jgi:hypothetical protein
MKQGREGGIRTRNRRVDSVSYRIQIAGNSKSATVAVDHCRLGSVMNSLAGEANWAAVDAIR